MNKKQALLSLQIKVSQHDLTCTEIARAYDCTRTYIHAVLKSDYPASLKTLLRINSAIDSVISERQTELDKLSNSIKISN